MEIGTLVKNQWQQFGLVAKEPSDVLRIVFGKVWVEWMDGTAGHIEQGDLVVISKPMKYDWEEGDIVYEWYHYQSKAIAPAAGKIMSRYPGDDDYPVYEILWSNDLKTREYGSTRPKYLISLEEAKQRIENKRSGNLEWIDKEDPHDYKEWWAAQFDIIDNPCDFQAPTNNHGFLSKELNG